MCIKDRRKKERQTDRQRWGRNAKQTNEEENLYKEYPKREILNAQMDLVAAVVAAAAAVVEMRIERVESK
jgi:hypothetical protein